jgi:hypothetical protein
MKNMWRASLREAISYELRITLGWYGVVAEGLVLERMTPPRYEYLQTNV